MRASIELTRTTMSGISPTIRSYVEAYQVRNVAQGKSSSPECAAVRVVTLIFSLGKHTNENHIYCINITS